MVLHQRVGVQDVGADLAAPRRLLLVAHHGGQLVLPLLKGALVELALQDVHRHLTVHVLRALVLARDDDARRQVGDADGGVRPVDVLPPRTAGPVGVHLQVLRADVDVHVVRELRRDEDRREARVPAVGGVERRDAHQTMHPPLRLQEPVGVVALHHHRGALDARLLVVRRLQHRRLEAVALRIAQVHAQQHLRPVLGVQPPRPGVYRQDRVGRVVFLVQEQKQAAVLHRAADLRRPSLELPLELGVLRVPQHVLQDGQVVHLAAQVAPAFNARVHARQVLQHGLVPVPRPEVRRRALLGQGL